MAKLQKNFYDKVEKIRIQKGYARSAVNRLAGYFSRHAKFLEKKFVELCPKIRRSRRYIIKH